MFIDDLKSGLGTHFSNLNMTSVNVCDLYLYGHSRDLPEVQIGLTNDATATQWETFVGETVHSMPTQITVYSGQINVGNETLNSRQAVEYITNEIIKWVEKNRLTLGGVKTLRRMSVSSTLPDQSGANIYYKVIRYDINAMP